MRSDLIMLLNATYEIQRWEPNYLQYRCVNKQALPHLPSAQIYNLITGIDKYLEAKTKKHNR